MDLLSDTFGLSALCLSVYLSVFPPAFSSSCRWIGRRRRRSRVLVRSFLLLLLFSLGSTTPYQNCGFLPPISPTRSSSSSLGPSSFLLFSSSASVVLSSVVSFSGLWRAYSTVLSSCGRSSVAFPHVFFPLSLSVTHYLSLSAVRLAPQFPRLPSVILANRGVLAPRTSSSSFLPFRPSYLLRFRRRRILSRFCLSLFLSLDVRPVFLSSAVALHLTIPSLFLSFFLPLRPLSFFLSSTYFSVFASFSLSAVIGPERFVWPDSRGVHPSFARCPNHYFFPSSSASAFSSFSAGRVACHVAGRRSVLRSSAT